MSDPVTLLVPTDERFRAIGPELAGKFCLAHGGTDADAAVLSDAVTNAMMSLAGVQDESASLKMDVQPSDGHVEVTVRCGGRSAVVTTQSR
jgi:hypothetical protein